MEEAMTYRVAINDLWDAPTLAHLLECDSTFGRLRYGVAHDDTSITVDGHRIPVSSQRDPVKLGWDEWPGLPADAFG